MSHHPRIVRRPPRTSSGLSWRSLRPAELFDTFRSYFGLGQAARLGPIDSRAALAEFVDTRASFIAQTALYGYLRTRMGMRYPELFDDDVFAVGINIAKWHVWLDCLGDLAVHAGGRLAAERPREADRVALLMVSTVDEILARTGSPQEAGADFSPHAGTVRDRVARTDWLNVGDREAAFTESPRSVLRWAPIADELKQLDEEIVLNSVRFHWQEVRRSLAGHLDAAAVLAGEPELGA